MNPIFTEDVALSLVDGEYILEIQIRADLESQSHLLRIEYNVLIPEGQDVSDDEMTYYSSLIKEYYCTLHDKRPDKLLFLFEYVFNHPGGRHENPVWLANVLYLGTAETIEALEIRLETKTALIDIETDFEDISEDVWSFDSNDSSTNSSDSLLNYNISISDSPEQTESD